MKRYFHRHQPAPKSITVLLAGLGAGLSIALVGYLGELSAYSLLIAPFGASCVLKFAVPASPLSQPMNVVGGHVLAAAIGFVLHLILPGNFAMAGAAVGLSLMAMMVLRVVHPPAGATALVGYLTATSWQFIVLPVLVGSVALVAVAALYHRIVTGTAYPHPVPKA